VGPVLGAVLLQLLGEGTRGLFANAPGVSLMLYGALLVLMVTFMPSGVLGVLRRRA